MASVKRQIVDPIGAVCRLALLRFSEHGTKLRIIDHSLQLTTHDLFERMLYRPYYGDSREDLCLLYPAIVRFVEICLMGKTEQSDKSVEKTILLESSNATSTSVTSDNSDNEMSGMLLDMSGMLLDFAQSQPQSKSNSTVASVKSTQSVQSAVKKTKTSDSLRQQSERKMHMKTLAKYAIEGLETLERTYGFCNATFTLHTFASLLQSGIDETYNPKMHPPGMRDNVIAQSAFDGSKLNEVWDNEIINAIVDNIVNCARVSSDHANLSKIYKESAEKVICEIDEKFREIVSQ